VSTWPVDGLRLRVADIDVEQPVEILVGGAEV
jgi:hypothetical protein